jgi:hypothetical protein
MASFDWHPSPDEVARIVEEMRPIITAFAHGTEAGLQHIKPVRRLVAGRAQLVTGVGAGSVACTAPQANSSSKALVESTGARHA